MLKQSVILAVVAALGILSTSPAMARNAGNTVVRVGAAMVDPAGDGLTVSGVGTVKPDDNTQLGIGVTHMLTDTVGIGVLGATPFKHDLLVAGTKVGTTRHLPPTVTVQYHPKMDGQLQPYVGAGVNYTQFYNETLALGDLELDESVGLALEAGLDYAISKNVGLNAAVWNVDIDTDASLGGTKLGTVEVDPWVYMLGAYYEF